MPSLRWVDDHEDSKGVLRQCLGYAALPVILAAIVFGPGLSGLTGLVYRVPLGVLWYLGAPIALIGLLASLFVQGLTRKMKRLYPMLLLGYIITAGLLHLSLPTAYGVAHMFSQNVPIGSNRTQVLSFLKTQNIYYWPGEGDLTALIPDRLFADGESFIYTTFEFDKKGKLARITAVHEEPDDKTAAGTPVTIGTAPADRTVDT